MSQTTDQRPLLSTRCGSCQHPFTLFASISMMLGHNSGHVTCPQCKELTINC